LWPGCSLIEISFEVVYYHIQDATDLSEQIGKISSSYAKLHGKVEDGELYIKAGFREDHTW
jgi:hypothetical protein